MGYYLYHHGILGQRWGKRNGPPYPLGASDHSASEKKAGWKKSLDKGSDKFYNSDRITSTNNLQILSKHWRLQRVLDFSKASLRADADDVLDAMVIKRLGGKT